MLSTWMKLAASIETGATTQVPDLLKPAILLAHMPHCGCGTYGTVRQPVLCLPPPSHVVEDTQLQQPLVVLADGRRVPVGDKQRVVTGKSPHPQLVPQVWQHRQQLVQPARLYAPLPPATLADMQFGYISLFPFLMRLIPPQSPILARQLDLIRDPERCWTDYGLRSLR